MQAATADARLTSRPVVKAILGLLVLLTVTGCGRATTPPAPTPTDFAGIVEQLAKAGIWVRDVVSGDAGCPDSALGPTAIAFSASGLDQPNPIRMRVYIFGNHEAWERLSGSVAACARSYVTDPSTYESLSPSPYVVSGQGPWPPAFAAGLKAAFGAGAGSGG